ncbi:MAG TPA: hypothetical protein VIP46_11810, partial [Pyrinomonadaceae bacterium]
SDSARAAAAGDPAVAARQSGALERGYRTGYSDGYQAGYRDSVESAARDHRSKEDYRRADRVYVPAYGSLEDYRDGYRQGFESGYEAGYDRRGFNSAVPQGIGRRGTADDDGAPTQTQRATTRPAPQIQAREDADDDDDRPASDSDAGRAGSSPSPAGRVASSGALVEIPQDTTLRVELLNNLSTDVSQRGDRFEARVLEPAPYADMVVTGRVSSVRRPGKIRGSGQLQLTFQQIRTNDGRWANFNAQVIDVVEKRTDSGVGGVDEEGGVSGKSTTKDDVTKVGAASGIGAIIGAIAGGGKGAAIGAVLGAGVGTGGVLTARGKDIRLERGQELMIRSATDTRIQ